MRNFEKQRLKNIIRKIILEENESNPIQDKIDEIKEESFINKKANFYLNERYDDSEMSKKIYFHSKKYIQDIEFISEGKFKILLSDTSDGDANSFGIFDCSTKSFDYDYIPTNPSKDIKITLYSTSLATKLLKEICSIKADEESQEEKSDFE